MGLADIVRGGVAIANNLTIDLQVDVQHEQLVSTDGAGKRLYAGAISRKALVDKKLKMVQGADGQMEQSQATITFLDPSTPVGAFDRLTLPDGTTGVIVNTLGFMDRATSQPFVTEVYLGQPT